MVFMGKNDTSTHNNTLILGASVVALLVIAFIVGRVSNNPQQVQTVAPDNTTSLQTTSISSITIAHNTSSVASNSSPTNNTIVQVLYSKKTVRLQAPTYNPYYNYVIGCYWTDGSYNFSFYAPYAGYLVFNETNTGIPANFTNSYFGAYISTQKPRYFKPQPYNETSFCPGFTMLSTTEPWTAIGAYNNQTLIVPIKNGTNYILFYNGNANDQHGVNPFPINVTFSITYYGFRGFKIPQTPNATVPTNIIPEWGKYGGG